MCIDIVYLNFYKAFDLGAHDMLFKIILHRNNRAHIKIAKNA